jgi:hypothetical protein
MRDHPSIQLLHGTLPVLARGDSQQLALYYPRDSNSATPCIGHHGKTTTQVLTRSYMEELPKPDAESIIGLKNGNATW